MLLIFNFLYIMFVFLFLCIYTNPATGCYMNKTILCKQMTAFCYNFISGYGSAKIIKIG